MARMMLYKFFMKKRAINNQLITFTLYLLSFLLCGIGHAADEVFVQEKEKAVKFIANNLIDLRMMPPGELFDEKDSNSSLLISKFGQLYPLVQNKNLDAAAERLCQSAFSENVDFTNSNATSIILKKEGYSPLTFHLYKIGVIMNNYISAFDAAKILLESFENILIQKIESNKLPEFYNGEYVELGIGFCGGVLQIQNEKEANVYLMTILLAAPEGPQPQWVQCGHVFYDKNNNKAYDLGEGLEEVDMTDENGTILAVTSNDGSYCFRRPKGDWILYLESFPFIQDFVTYQQLLSNKKAGILYKDYPLLVTQDEIIAAKNLN